MDKDIDPELSRLELVFSSIEHELLPVMKNVNKAKERHKRAHTDSSVN